MSSPADRFRHGFAAAVDLDVSKFDRPGTMIHPEADRSGSSVAVAYAVGSATVIRCDPALVEALNDLVASAGGPDIRTPFERLGSWAAERGWGVVDGADNHVLPARVAPIVDRPPDAELRSLDRRRADDRALIANLVAACDPEEVDEAEIELDDLDPRIVAALRADGSIGAYASARPWDLDATFDDIGVLTHPELRRRGWASAAVAALAHETLTAGCDPLYRCNWSVVASKRTAQRLGFEVVAQLFAVTSQPDT